jgi:tetratricopeptide (TPR) repeat protein
MEIALMDEEALIRRTAVTNIYPPDPEKLAKLLAPMLYDPIKTVRIEAARRLAGARAQHMDADQQELSRTVLQEFEDAMEYSADFAFARHNLANLYAELNRPEDAIRQYEEAIRIDKQFFPAIANLAVLYNQKGQNEQAEQLLREAVTAHPELYDLAYSLGLLLVEMQRSREAVTYIEQASKGMPGRARIHYNLGLLYQSLQDPARAGNELHAALAIEPQNLDFQYGLADHYLKMGRFEEARPIVENMVRMHPGNPIGKQMLDFIQRNTGR